MSEIFNDVYSDINFLENEKFDFDLPFSPTLPEDSRVDRGDVDDDDDEVFFGPVGFTEQCMSTRVASIQEEASIKPLSSPLSGEQVVELFTEATKIALHIERLSTETSGTNPSCNSSETSSILSNSYLKLSNHSSSSGNSQSSTGKSSSSGNSGGRPTVLSNSGFQESNDKENVRPVARGSGMESTVEGSKVEKKKKESKLNGPLASRQSNTPLVSKIKKGIPKAASKLPRSKNTEKTFSAFSSPIKVAEHDHHNELLKNDNQQTTVNSQIKNPKSVEKSGKRKSQQLTKLSSLQKNVSCDKGTPSTVRNRSSSSKTLTKRNIFHSTESLSEFGTKDGRSKLPVPEQSKIPGPKSRRRRSSSTSSVSSQSSTSSQAPAEEGSSKTSKLTKQIPSTKASLASSLPLGLLRRSSKVHVQDSTSEKKTQPIKALPRSAVGSWKNTNTDTASSNPSGEKVRSSSDDLINDKVPLAATPQPVQSSIPVMKRRSSLRRPATTGKKSTVTGDTDGSQRRRSLLTDYGTPNKQDGKAQPNIRKTRRSLLPTPSRNKSTRSRVPSDDPPAVPLSPAITTKKENVDDKIVKTITVPDNGQLLINTDSPMPSNVQSIDDLLQLDDTTSLMSGVMPIQPKPVSHADLIDLTDI